VVAATSTQSTKTGASGLIGSLPASTSNQALGEARSVLCRDPKPRVSNNDVEPLPVLHREINSNSNIPNASAPLPFHCTPISPLSLPSGASHSPSNIHIPSRVCKYIPRSEVALRPSLALRLLAAHTPPIEPDIKPYFLFSFSFLLTHVTNYLLRDYSALKF
jgi:hypothetical protein